MIDNVRALRAALAQVGNPGDHDHRHGAAGCKICSKHDHSNKAPFGAESTGEEVPGWWFTCPRCGSDDNQAVVTRWFPAGIAHMKRGQ